jgi:hypothetical protein
MRSQEPMNTPEQQRREKITLAIQLVYSVAKELEEAIAGASDRPVSNAVSYPLKELCDVIADAEKNLKPQNVDATD